ncbi:MAG TPA: glycerol-3-phosphate 1-O-acyltransferase PlsY [Methylomirabilota bacterium]|nr:glycerol-3-phosphate 1-O-acyltransferase PlsY [Methylomirabilota bacterium]
MAVRALGLVVVYLIGAIPVGFIVTRLAGGGDIRSAGSGTIGATNVLRTAGKLPALVTLLGDIVKGYLAVLVARRLGPESAWAAAGAVLAVVGNCWPVFLRFRGGKGVATGFGAFLNLAVWATAPAALVWIAVAASFRFASLASILASLCLPLGVLALGYGWAATAAAVIAAAIIVGRHHENIRRLLRGTERRLGERAAAS